jgi:hypothetical protein
VRASLCTVRVLMANARRDRSIAGGCGDGRDSEYLAPR